jgi:hypothetical protein
MRKTVTMYAVLANLLGFAATAAAQHAGDMLIGSTADGGGALQVAYDFEPTLVLTLSFEGGGVALYGTTDPGFDALVDDAPGASFFALDAGTTVHLEIVDLDPEVSLKLGAVLSMPGATALVGTMPALHVHPEWLLTLPADAVACRRLSFRLTATAPYAASPVYTAKLANADAQCAGTAPTPSPTPTPRPAPTGRACGDADGNGIVDVIDAANVLRAAVGLASACALAPAACDVDAGGAIDVIDAANVLRAAVALPAQLGCEE